MHTAAPESKRDTIRRAASEPVDSIHPFNIPIPPSKHPPSKEDFSKTRRPRKKNDTPLNERSDSDIHREEGHIDDYA